MLTPSDLAFDAVIPSPIMESTSIAVSPDGLYSVVSSRVPGNQGTFLEKVNSTNIPPVKIHDEPSNTVGFYGRDTRMIAFESNGVLFVYNLELLRVVRNIKVLPGSLFVSLSGRAPYIGAITPGKRKVFYCDEYGNHYMTKTSLREYAMPMWASSTTNGIFFSGQAWSGDDSIMMELRSHEGDSPSIVSSDYPVTLFRGVDAAIGDDSVQRALFTTSDEPHILKKLEKTVGSDTPLVDKVASVASLNSQISSVVTDNNLNPVIGVSYNTPIPDIALLAEENSYTSLLATRIYRGTERCELAHNGSSTLVSFTETPSLSPVIDIQSYALSGRPIKRVISQSPVGCIARESSIRNFSTSDGKYIDYRLVSKFDAETSMVDQAVIIPDPEGRILGGGYSPTVSTLVSSGVAVAIVGVNRKYSPVDTKKTLAADISELAKNLLGNRIAKRVGVLTDGRTADAMRALVSSRKLSKNISKVDIFRPSAQDIASLSPVEGVLVNTIYVEGDEVTTTTKKTSVIELPNDATLSSRAVGLIKDFWG